ncbi:MAG TPA: hypothetical protein PKM73_03440 [Verrucomicrobiota bacterium]|nr:hypothetical protein [Verrucomicrobiota bacterium]HNU50411.1 hypothetical protein [Verrucomicrobiota bacterium]
MRRNPSSPINRRRFVHQSAQSAGWLLLGASAARTLELRAGSTSQPNPFAYDVRALSRTDPAVIGYREAARWQAPHPEARRLAITDAGQLLVASGHSISRMDANGNVIAAIPLPGPAHCLTTTPEGALYVGLGDHIAVYDAQGKPSTTWSAPAQKAWLTGLSAGPGVLYAADAGNRVVWCFDTAGKILRQLGRKDTRRGIPGFVVPSPFFDLRWHRDGLLRVANPGRHRIEAYTPEGDLEFFWGKPTAAIDGFCGCCNPCHFTLMTDGRYLTCEKGLPRVKVYREHGDFECVVAGAESFPENLKHGSGQAGQDRPNPGLDVAVDRQGRVFILDPATGAIHVRTPNPPVAT